MPKLAACGSDSGHIFYNANFQNLRVTTIPANAYQQNNISELFFPIINVINSFGYIVLGNEL